MYLHYGINEINFTKTDSTESARHVTHRNAGNHLKIRNPLIKNAIAET